MSSIKSDQEMLALAGVTMSTYNLLRDIYEGTDGKKISKNNRLLIFLCKIKLGLSYSAFWGTLFGRQKNYFQNIYLHYRIFGYQMSKVCHLAK